MTSEPVNPAPEARERMDAYLDAIERVLVAAHMPRAERKGIADDVEAQILEMLAARGHPQPSVEDVEAVLSDLDPPEAYAEAGGVPPASTRPAPSPVPPSALPRKADRPHFSRAAIVGACWAPLALALAPLVLLVLWPMLSSSGVRRHTPEEPVMHLAPQGAAPTEEKSENTAVSATDAEQEAAEQRAMEARREAAQRRLEAELKQKAPMARAEGRVERGWTLSWFAILILMPLGLLGLSAPFGTTILGIVAISHIRRSGGRIYGMGLALFDALLFPLVLLDVLTVWLLVSLDLGDSFAGRLAVGLAVAVAADAVIAWLVWRALRGTPDEAAEMKKYRTLGIVSLALCLVGVLFAVPMVGRGFVGQASFLAFLGCEIAALVCGILAWRATPLAKAGTVTSSVLMALSLLLMA